MRQGLRLFIQDSSSRAMRMISAVPILTPPHLTSPTFLSPPCLPLQASRPFLSHLPSPTPAAPLRRWRTAAVCVAKLAVLRELLRKRRADRQQRGGKRVTRTTAYRRLSHLSLSSVACPSRSFSAGNVLKRLPGPLHSSLGCPPRPPARTASIGKRTGILSVSCLLSHNFSSAPSALTGSSGMR